MSGLLTETLGSMPIMSKLTHRRLERIRIRHAIVAAIVTAAVSLWYPLSACDTPVYRYAMYNWLSSDFQVYYLHDGATDPIGDEANRALVELIEDATPPLNLEFVPLDISDQRAAASLPRDVELWLDENESHELPVHLVFSPHGDVLHAGRLEAADVAAVVNSPTRRHMTELLDLGHTGVLLLLASGDESADARAEAEIEKVIQQAAAGEITPFTLPGAGAIDGIEIDDLSAPSEEQPLEVATIKISRSDPAETWLVRSLLAIESDLNEIDEPMVFAVYGRARAMEPYVGPGITAKNLAGCVAFIAGSCSCEVKEQNPGMDLLVRWDWESTAQEMAARMGEEEGNEDFFTVERLLPSVVGAPAAPMDVADSVVRAGEESRPRADDTPYDERSPGGAFGGRLLRRLGLGVGLAVAVLLVVSVLIFRLRSTG